MIINYLMALYQLKLTSDDMMELSHLVNYKGFGRKTHGLF